MTTDQEKLFPIFRGNKRKLEKTTSEISTKNNKKFKGLAKDQLLLDAGQKQFGATQCYECDLVYHKGDPGDEVSHFNYHDAITTLTHNGWKNERVVQIEENNRIIKIIPGDSKLWWKKAKTLMEFISRDYGLFDMTTNIDECQIYINVTNKKITGCLVAELQTSALKYLGDNGVEICSQESYPIKCGLVRIWVSKNHRKKGFIIGYRLMDALKRNFIKGYFLSDDEIGLGSPSELERNFAITYFKKTQFLMYT